MDTPKNGRTIGIKEPNAVNLPNTTMDPEIRPADHRKS